MEDVSHPLSFFDRSFIMNEQKTRPDNTNMNFARSTREQLIYLFIFVMFLIISVIVSKKSSAGAKHEMIWAGDTWVTEEGVAVNPEEIPLGSHTISKNIKDLPTDGESLCFRSIDTDFTVYADDKQIYDYHPEIPGRFGKSFIRFPSPMTLPV